MADVINTLTGVRMTLPDEIAANLDGRWQLVSAATELAADDAPATLPTGEANTLPTPEEPKKGPTGPKETKGK